MIQGCTSTNLKRYLLHNGNTKSIKERLIIESVESHLNADGRIKQADQMAETETGQVNREGFREASKEQLRCGRWLHTSE
jgi:hypothetical protein